MGPLEEGEPGLRSGLARVGQSHLLRFWPALEPAEREALAGALRALGSPEELGAHCLRATQAYARQQQPGGHREGPAGHLRPVPSEFFGSAARSEPATLEGWQEEGEHWPESWGVTPQQQEACGAPGRLFSRGTSLRNAVYPIH